MRNTSIANIFFASFLALLLFTAAGCDGGKETALNAPSNEGKGIEDTALGDDATNEGETDDPSSTNDNDSDSNDDDALDASTADWQTYEGDGFSIQYPPHWRVSESGGLYRIPDDVSADFQMPEEFDYELREKITTLNFFSEANDNNISLEQYWEEIRNDEGLKEKLQLGKEHALSAVCGGISYSECILALHNGKKYQLTVDYIFDTGEVRSEIRRMLATFTFAD